MDKQDILDYLDAEVHPLVSPDHYYVYSNLHDMVSELPTVDTEPQWIPCSEQMPNEYEPVITSTPRGIMIMERVMEWDGYMWQDEADDLHIIGFVQAWIPLPKPYEVKQ